MVKIDFLRRLFTAPLRMFARHRAAARARRPAAPLPPAHWEDDMLYMLPPFY